MIVFCGQDPCLWEHLARSRQTAENSDTPLALRFPK
jgi:hypothetical protein